MITNSGALCDVCGNYILPIHQNEMVHTFSVKGISEQLHCDNKCKEIKHEIECLQKKFITLDMQTKEFGIKED